MDALDKIKKALEKFSLNLNNKVVLTEAASGNFVVTSVIAALAGAKVYALAKHSEHGTVGKIKKQTDNLAREAGVSDQIEVIEDLEQIDLKGVDVVTNTGFLRPINAELVDKLSSKCVIPLMWEPWEYREEDLDLVACALNGIKIYGTNEDDERIQTKKYLGDIVFDLLLKNQISVNSKILLIGCEDFVEPVEEVLKKNSFSCNIVTDYSSKIEVDGFDSIVLLEHRQNRLLVGGNDALIPKEKINENTFVIHICGNVDFSDAVFKFIPENPAAFGYMSFRADHLDNKAVIDLHTAGLKVAEGMLKANSFSLQKKEYKEFMEKNYPALAFEDSRFW